MKASVSACVLLASTAIATPRNIRRHHHHPEKRAIDMITETKVVMETVTAMQTAWVYPDGRPVSSDGAVHPQAVTSAIPHPANTGALAPASSQEPVSSAAPSSTQAPPPPSPSPPPPAPPAPASSQAPRPPAQGSGSNSRGQTFTGDMTYYDVGLGSCGWTSTPNEDIVAVPHQMMSNGANPNNNPNCGKMVTIHYGGKTKKAKVVDTCGGCSPGDLDMSTGLFKFFAPMSEGRVGGMKWSYDN